MATGFADINGGKIYFEIEGHGPALVMIHGGLVNHHLWDDQFDYFVHQGYQVLRFDVRGYGQSSIPDRSFSYHNDLKLLMDSLGLERAVIMGLSMGGGIAIDFTLTYPDKVTALIAVAAGLSGFQNQSEVSKQMRTAQNAAYEKGDKAQAVELSLQLWTDGPNRAQGHIDPIMREKIRAMTTEVFDLPDYDNSFSQELQPPAIDRLAEIHVPTLFIVGDQDVPDILEIADIVTSRVPGAQKAVIANTAHHLNMERPAEFNHTVLDFLKSLQA
jgi:pimeloyl-ACP methyl ester carboxylesterase